MKIEPISLRQDHGSRFSTEDNPRLAAGEERDKLLANHNWQSFA